MTSRELIRWAALHDRRARGRGRSPVVIAVVAGVALAGWVAVRGDAGAANASHAWLGVALVVAAVAFLRVPFLVYWRGDAGFLAQLPLEGSALVDVALWRCAKAAAATTAVLAIGALPLPLARGGDEAVMTLLRHLAFAATLGLAAGAAMPAVALYTAGLVAREQAAGAIGAVGGGMPAPPTALLGAGPGFVATGILAVLGAASPWLMGEHAMLPAGPALGGVAVVSVVALMAVRAGAGAVMAKILRDVSALDRQRLATLEISPPTTVERMVAAILGDAGLVYRKDARLMRRRYPMAFALGGLGFVVVVVVGLARPVAWVSWLVTLVVGAAVYAAVLAARLGRPPIELSRLSATLPLAPAGIARARAAWVVTWLVVFAVVPAVFALVRLAL